MSHTIDPWDPEAMLHRLDHLIHHPTPTGPGTRHASRRRRPVLPQDTEACRREIAAAGLTQGRAAFELGIGETTMSRYMNGLRPMPKCVLLSLADLLDVDVRRLCNSGAPAWLGCEVAA